MLSSTTSSKHSGDATLLLGAVAGAAAVGAAWMWASQRSASKAKFQIPKQLLQSPYSEELRLAVKVAIQGKYK